MRDSTSKYDSSVGRQLIRTNGNIVCVGYDINNPPTIIGRVKERYNSSNGIFELVDDDGRVVGFVPKSLRGGSISI